VSNPIVDPSDHPGCEIDGIFINLPCSCHHLNVTQLIFWESLAMLVYIVCLYRYSCIVSPFCKLFGRSDKLKLRPELILHDLLHFDRPTVKSKHRRFAPNLGVSFFFLPLLFFHDFVSVQELDSLMSELF